MNRPIQQDKHYRYTAFGLKIECCLACPELSPGCKEGVADITIRLGTVPDNLESATASAAFCQAAPNRLLLSVPGVARYLVRDGREIIMETTPETDIDSLRLLLLGSAMGALLLQRGKMVLHASVIATPKGAVAFLGTSRAGKSTLAAVFHQRSYPIVADEMCAVTINEKGIPLVLPEYVELKLWADTIERSAPQGCRYDRYDRGWTNTGCRLQTNTKTAPLPLSCIYLLSTNHTAEHALAPIRGAERFQTLQKQTYRPSFVKGLGIESEYFRLCTALGSQIPMVQASRPRNTFMPNRLADLVEQNFSS